MLVIMFVCSLLTMLVISAHSDNVANARQQLASLPIPNNCTIKSLGGHGSKYTQLFCKDLTRHPVFNFTDRNIRLIKIVNSHIGYLNRDTFKPFPMVQTIVMSYCYIVYVTRDTFDGLRNLNAVSLSWNPFNMTTLTNATCAFSPQKKIAVYFRGTFLRGMSNESTAEFLKCLEQRKINLLDLSFNTVNSKFIKDVFCAARKSGLGSLLVSGMTVSDSFDLTPDFFICLENSSLTYLDISNNGFRKLEDDSFKFLKSLKTLKLSGVQMAFLIKSMKIFQKLPHLQTLFLSDNNFKDFNRFTWVPLGTFPSLKNLFLKGNSFWWLKSFGNAYPNLTKLDISANIPRFGSIPSLFISNLTSLKHLTLNRTSIDRAGSTAFDSNSLEILELNNVELQVDAIQSQVFQRCQNLIKITMNTLTVKDDKSRGLHKYLFKFFKHAFRNIPSLEHIELKHNRIAILNSRMFEGTNKLRYLDLSNNLLQEIQPGAISNLQQLAVLNMDVNRLTTINKTSIPDNGLPSTLELSLGYNPWSCDCDLYWFRKLMDQDNGSIIIDNTDKHNYQCDSPPTLNKMNVMEYNPTWNECHMDGLSTTFYSMITTSAGLFLMFMSVSLFIRFRWHIYFIYINARARARDYKQISDDNEYEFDAFVAYHNKDAQWVIKYLKPFLEEEHKLKICLHDRDWEVGADIVDNIVYSITHSRKIIFVVTNWFTQSNWCQLELTMAQQKFFNEDKCNMILIMKEKILDCYMTPRLALQIKTQTYIEWHEGRMQQKVFWTKLMKAITGQIYSIKGKPM